MSETSNWVNSKPKRILDLIVGSTLFALCAPIMGVIAALLRLRQGPPVLFRQERPGKDERVFTLYKFPHYARAGSR